MTIEFATRLSDYLAEQSAKRKKLREQTPKDTRLLDAWVRKNRIKFKYDGMYALNFIPCADEEKHSLYGHAVKHQERIWKEFDKGSSVVHLDSGQLFIFLGILSGLHDTTAVVKAADDKEYSLSISCLEQLE